LSETLFDAKEDSSRAVTAIILAAGQGTRMRSSLPKVLHPLAGKPLIAYSLRLARQLGSADPVVIIGHGADQVRQAVGSAARFALQQPQLGTGHAVQQAEALLSGQDGLVLVMSADMPLFTYATLRALVDLQHANPGPLSMLTMLLDDSHGFGRVVRAADGSVAEVVEEAQATPQQLAIRELNVGAYCFRAGWLWQALRRVPLSPKGEYYLTDVVGIAVADGLKVQALVLPNPDEAIGINTRVHLAEAEAILRRRTNQAWMSAGVTMIDPETTYIEADVTIGGDTLIYPNTLLQGNTNVGSGCVLGPNTVIRDSVLEDGCHVTASVVENARLPRGSAVGPFEHVRERQSA
jgi:bifunctional UDP-N-acetylglucosamine pyrophosphorylase/glucosamine-1-phosphate N-acetyltransferase